jgi:hypothetical protein
MTRCLILLGAAGLLALAGCREDDLLDCAPTALTLKDFSQRTGVPVQTFALTLGSSQTITTAGGAALTFPANSLLLPGGSAATGVAQVRIREIYTVPDMVLADMPTGIWRGGDMLVSGGEFNIQVWQNTARLRLAPGQSVALQSPIPADQDTTPQLVWQQPASLMVGDSAGWQLATAAAVQTLPGLYRASIPLDSVGWWNLDQFWHAYASASSTRVTVKTRATAVGATRVFLRPVGYNGLLKLWPTTTAGTDWLKNAPLGADMVAVVLQSINGQLHYGTQRVTISSGLVITPVVSPVSEAEAVQRIRQL